MKKLPNNLIKYKETPRFNEDNIPAAILKVHNTKAGVWGLIVIEKGQLEYEIIQSSEKHILTPTHYGVVEPTVNHRVRPLGEVIFYIEFYQTNT